MDSRVWELRQNPEQAAERRRSGNVSYTTATPEIYIRSTVDVHLPEPETDE